MGYRVGHYRVKLNRPSPHLTIHVNRVEKDLDRKALAGVFPALSVREPALGRPIAVPFKPHLADPGNMCAAAIHRFGCDVDIPDPQEIKLFEEYAKHFIVKNFSSLHDGDVDGFDEWLEKTNYPGGRMKDLKRIFEEFCAFDGKELAVKSFIKDEGYMEPKNPRGINSYSDLSKTILGPIVKAVDKKTFSTRYFVKGTNPKDWPDRLHALFGDEPVQGTDFSSFEAHHEKTLSKVVWFWMMHMIRNLTGSRQLKAMITAMMMGVNNIRFKWLKVEIAQRLMSGALWTSSANGVLNLCLLSFMTARKVNPTMGPEELASWATANFVGLCEGDDGICKDVGIEDDQIRKLGLKLKMERARNYAECGFCGIVCGSSRDVLKDPIATMRKFFVLPAKFALAKDSTHNALLRARAMSYCYNFGNCPVIGSMCHAVLRATRGVNTSRFEAELTDWTFRNCIEAAKKEKPWQQLPRVHMESRLLVEKRFGLPIETQLRIEKAFDEHRSGPFMIPLGDCLDTITLQHALDFVVPDVRAYAEPHFDPPPLIREVMENGLKGVPRVAPERVQKHYRSTRMCFEKVWRRSPVSA